MNRFRDRLQRMMYGRYGSDQLNRAILMVALVLIVVNIFVRNNVLYILGLLLLVVGYFRMFSRNIYKRSGENTKYLNATAGIRNSFTRLKNRKADRAHVYFKCPSCKQTVRVPRGRGKICITCPKCSREFVKRT